MRPKLILASSSPRRLALLELIGIRPDSVVPADIDETPREGELARDLAGRLALEKAEAVAAREKGALILAADTVVAVGRRILPKAEDEATVRECLKLLSGRAHRVYSGVALAGPGDERRLKIVETRVKVRRLEAGDIDAYIASGEWNGKAGGYAIQGLFAAHIIEIIGSHPNVVGLPLYQTVNLLRGVGWRA
ncbi:MAG: Maf family nucleotide pyrophosphatase [Amphiplicatus sp.]